MSLCYWPRKIVLCYEMKFFLLCIIFQCYLKHLSANSRAGSPICVPWGSSMQPFSQLSKFSLHLLVLIGKKSFYNWRNKLIDFQFSEDLKFKFLACHILNFYENHILPSGRLAYFITRNQKVVNMFGTTYCCERSFALVSFTPLQTFLKDWFGFFV